MTSDLKSKRPLSPHLQIYKPQLTSMTSILHRISGFGLSIGLILFALWIWGAAYNADLFHCIIDCAGSVVGIVLLAGWSFAFYYHLANGIRHLIWDAGYLLDIENAYKLGYLVLGFSLFATVGTWIFIAWELL